MNLSTKGMFGLGKKKPAFPVHFLFTGSEFCMSVYQAIGGAGIFFQQGLIFLENNKNWFSFVLFLNTSR